MFSQVIQDIRYAVRTFLRNRGFVIVALLTIALGIGATTSIFSLVDAVLLRPLPYHDPQHLVAMFEDFSSIGFLHKGVSAGTYADIKAQKELFEDVAAASEYDETLADNSGELHGFNASVVTANMFLVLGVKPLLGRTFLPGEDSPGREHVVLLSYRLWRSFFDGNPSIVGQEIRLHDEKYTVVGVMPPWFSLPQSKQIEMWRPIVFTPQDYVNRTARGLNAVIGRRRSGVSLQRVNSELALLEKQAALQYPDDMKGENRYFAEPLEESYTRDARAGLDLLMAAVSFILLIACANVANLLLSRAAGRQREIAVRTALGAKRSRIIRQLLTESALLAFLGGVLGVFLALASFGFLKNLIPENLTRTVSLTINFPVLIFAGLTALSSSFVFGLAPALRTSSFSLSAVLKESSRGNTGSGYKKLGDVFIVGEVALSLMLLVGASLFIKSLWNLRHVELGFEPDHVLTSGFLVSGTKYRGDPDLAAQNFPQRTQFLERVLEKVRAIPGVESAGLTSVLPLTWKGGTIGFTPEGVAVWPETPDNANERVVSPGYFETMKIPLIRGRNFDDHDTEDAPLVAIVNQTMAREFWPNQDVLGKRFKDGYPSSNTPWVQIVGIVGDVKQMGLGVPPRQQVYFPLLQSRGNYMVWWFPSLAVRTGGEPRQYVEEVRQAVKAVEPEAALNHPRPMNEIVEQETTQNSIQTMLLSSLAALALVMACIGIYGVMAYMVAQRKFEMGIRMALGAHGRNILGLVLGHGSKLAAAGVSIGIVAAVALTRFMRNLLFEVSPSDPLTLAGVAFLLTLVGLAACYIPARRAMNVDPIVALRYE